MDTKKFISQLNKDWGVFLFDSRMRFLVEKDIEDINILFKDLKFEKISFEKKFDGYLERPYPIELYNLIISFRGNTETIVAISEKYNEGKDKSWYIEGYIDYEDTYEGHLSLEDGKDFYEVFELSRNEEDSLQSLFDEFELFKKCTELYELHMKEHLDKLANSYKDFVNDDTEVSCRIEDSGIIVTFLNQKNGSKKQQFLFPFDIELTEKSDN